MKIETAYKVANLVRQHQEAEKLHEEIKKRRDQYSYNDPEGSNGLELAFDLNGVDSETFELVDHNEIMHFHNFLVDIVGKRVQDFAFSIDKIGPEVEMENLRIIRMSYEQYLAAIKQEAWVHIDDMRLADLPISRDELAGADEVWIVKGDHQRRLK